MAFQWAEAVRLPSARCVHGAQGRAPAGVLQDRPAEDRGPAVVGTAQLAHAYRARSSAEYPSNSAISFSALWGTPTPLLTMSRLSIFFPYSVALSSRS